MRAGKIATCIVVLCLFVVGFLWIVVEKVAGEEVRPIDGDTVAWRGMRYRLLGFDAPEIEGKCPAEIAKAREAKRALQDMIARAEIIDIRPRGDLDRYGRRLAWLNLDGEDVAQDMIASGLAREYHGAPRRGWCPPGSGGQGGAAP